MRRRTFICVSFAVALHGAAFLALDRFWFLAATHRPPVDPESVIELVPSVPEAVALPVALAAAVPPPHLATALELEKQLASKPEPKVEPKTEVKPEPLLQPKPAPPALEVVEVVASDALATSASLASTPVPVNASAVNAAVNLSFVANDHPSPAPLATPPAYRRNPKPMYPANARLKKQEGDVLLTVEVSAQGRALRVEVATSSGFASLDEAALTTVLRRWRFEPARLDGVPTVARVQVPVRFQLDN